MSDDQGLYQHVDYNGTADDLVRDAGTILGFIEG